MRTNTGLFGNLVRQLKTDSIHIICQPIRILLNNPIHFLPILFVDPQCECCCNPVLCQEHHCLTQILLFMKLLIDFSGFPLTDAFNLCQPFRLFFNNPESIFLKLFHNPRCQ